MTWINESLHRHLMAMLFGLRGVKRQRPHIARYMATQVLHLIA